MDAGQNFESYSHTGFVRNFLTKVKIASPVTPNIIWYNPDNENSACYYC